MVSAKVEEPPPAFDPVIVYMACAVTAVGVPLMTPVPDAMLNPTGNAGETTKDVADPDGVIVGETLEIAVPLVYVWGVAYAIAICETTKVNDAVVLPPEFVAVIVTPAEAYAVVGVPLI